MITRPVNIRVTGGIDDSNYESFVDKMAMLVDEYGLMIEENIG